MPSRCAGWVMLAVTVAAAAGCGKGRTSGGTADGAASIALTAPDGAPLVGPIKSEPFVPGAGGDAELRACRVAIRRPDWGPGGNLGSLQFRLRTVRARGPRDAVLKVAHEQLCQEDGIPVERCTDDLFLKEYEWCEGDPRPATRPLSPEMQKLADQIREGAKPGAADAGTPAADATAPREMPPYAPDGAPMIY